MGSKNRISKHILPIILKDRKEWQWYVEPFVGGGNLIDKVKGNRLGADSNKYVIRALEYIRDKTPPKDNTEFSEDDYNESARFVRGENAATLKDYGLIGFALIAYSFGAKWCGGWSRGKNSKGEQRDYVAEQYRAAIKQKPLLKGVAFMVVDYKKLGLIENSIVYCDPPYEGTTKYKDDFKHDEFWEWCREKVKEGHKVFISEYNAPADFVCVWQQELGVSVSKTGSHKIATEKLFIHESQNETN
ncbi:DNA adenine methylase [Flavobacteriaceae bacterium]|nr:DNA adenine methylase [Flavobacteriaceae bacterium]